MTTSYSLTDTLPKDLGGAKHLGIINDATSQLDYALIRGIAAEPLGAASRNLALIGVGSHTIGSAVSHGGGVGVIAIYTESPSAIGTGNMQMLRSDKEGALYTRPASAIMSYMAAASVQTHLTGSLLLHGVNILGIDVNAGNTVKIEDGTAFRLGYAFTATSEVIDRSYTGGLHFGTSVRVLSSNTNASVTLLYSRY